MQFGIWGDSCGMSKIYIQPPNDDSFDNFLMYAKQNAYNMEIASFAYSDILDTNWQVILKSYQRKLHDFEGDISVHGAFQDLTIHSKDKQIRKITRDRIFLNLKISEDINAKYIVFHGNFIPLITRESYKQNWIEQNANFWLEVLDKYSIIILIENLWEPTPEIFRELLYKVNSPRLKICFDTGHANIFSKVPIKEWIALLNKDIAYIHINDNKGVVDDELVPGEGTVDWQEFSELIKKHQITPEIVLEVGTLEKTRQSLKYFEEEKLYPFNEN